MAQQFRPALAEKRLDSFSRSLCGLAFAEGNVELLESLDVEAARLKIFVTGKRLARYVRVTPRSKQNRFVKSYQQSWASFRHFGRFQPTSFPMDPAKTPIFVWRPLGTDQ
jgi:hypothetical protein